MDTNFEIFSRLPERDLRKEGVLIAEGWTLAERALRFCDPLGMVVVESALQKAEQLARGRCPVHALPEPELARLAGYSFHRGVMLAARRPEIPSLDGKRAVAPGRYVLISELSDPENMGAVLRTAAALGWDGALLGPVSPDPFSRRSLRCSMGAALSLPLWRFTGPEDLRGYFGAGWTLAAAALEPEAKEPGSLRDCDTVVLVLGNEAFGISPGIRALCTLSVAIPQARGEAQGVDSLNVAAAAAILLWEARRK